MTAPADDFPIDTVFGPEIAEVMREWARAIVVFGHDAAADDAVGLHALGAKATAFMQIADDRATGAPQRRNLPAAKKKAVQSLVIGLGFLAAINREIAREHGVPA
ncbi:MAG: hypothetical protein A2792_00265 [Sphingomonadales bacterium RIFCSPHIGHO2_01_FULL_65_20]|nr:MAG: hypothetical protein A2792_00265 [Sphingomonadales bacterium RIFCSPHIGHO2_01_FULL_65_20]